MFSEDPILLPEIVDQIVLVTVHPPSEREDEELQRRRHSLRLLGRLDQHRPSLGRFFRTIRGDDVPPLQGHPGLSDASEGTGVPESRGEVGVQDPEHHDGARDTRWRDDRMTGRRSHGRLSALNGVVHQGTARPLDDAFSPANQCGRMALPGRPGAGMCERQRHHAVPA